MLNRRSFLASPVAAALLPRRTYAAQLAALHGDIYRQLGIRPLINAAGTYTTLTGSTLVPQARDAMVEASKYFVPFIELQQAVATRLTKLLDVPAAMVTSGGTGSIMLATAACVTGKDQEKIRRIPDTAGMKNEVIMVRQHRMGFDHACRSVGVRIVEVETVDALKAAINPKTAMLFWVNIYEPKGQISAKQFLEAGKSAGVPVFNDAAAELPPADNLTALVKQGFDLVGFSGGKALRGPQASGLLVGRADLIEAAHMNNNPHSDTIGRAAKVGKEELMALLAAVEVWVKRDHAADMKLWHSFMQSIARDLKRVQGVTAEVYIPPYPGAHPVPFLRVKWDQTKVPVTYADCAKRLREGEPRVEVNAAADELTLASYLLNPGEERIVGWRLAKYSQPLLSAADPLQSMRYAAIATLLLSISSPAQQRFIVAVGGIMHESNSFNPAATTLKDFRVEEPSPGGEDLLAYWRKSSSELSGYVTGAEKAGLQLKPTLFANATPKGPVSREAFENLTGRLIARLKAEPKLDGLLLALHGAMVSEEHPHGDEEIVRRIRQALGPKLPIVVTHDFHANVSPEIVKLSTVLITYKQNPHLDTKDRGEQAARIMGQILRGEVKPVQVVVKPPMVYNIIFQNTYAEPFLPITKDSMVLESKPKILAVSVSGGYQYADVPYMGPSVVVATNGDEQLAQSEAKRLSDRLWATRELIRLRLPDPAQAVKEAMAATKFPVALFDTGDNIGGGSAGDSTFILEELVRQKAAGWVMAIADAAAVQAAIKAGINGTFDMPVGGKTDNAHGKPVRIRGRVKSLHSGEYIETQVRHGGGRYHQLGVSAVIEAEGSTRDLQNLLLVTTNRSSPNSIHQLVSCGIYPERQRILVAKGTIAPRAAYEPVAASIVPVDSPGATAVNPARFKFKRVRELLFGID